MPQTSEMNWMLIFYVVMTFILYSFLMYSSINLINKFNMLKNSFMSLSFFSLF